MPPENLQDFMVDQRGGGGGVDLPQQIHENHMLRDVANRSPMAVLFESMLPWNNYGTGDDDREGEPANEE